MQGDYSRLTFRPERRYSSVRLQQGRVTVDADWNEQADIAAYLERTALTDVIGPSGTPEPGGFEVTPSAANLTLGQGRYYVHGILCENAQDETLPVQPYLPDVPLPTTPAVYLAYLDVWERHVTYLDDALIREVALEGPDTATRHQVVWQVKFENVGGPGTTPACVDFGDDWNPSGTVSTGRLRAKAETPPDDPNECLVPPGAGYRRQENQLYRVEIHGTNASGNLTYKWSRENGSVVSRLTAINGDVLTIDPPGRDENLGFTPGQWVELSDEGRVLRGEPGVLVQLGPVQGDSLTVADWGAGGPLTMADFGTLPTVRRWDSPGAVELTTGAFVELEAGVQVEFDGSAGNDTYLPGDYWIFPARTATAQVEWPIDAATSDPIFLPRFGTIHHYAALALVEWDGTAWTLISDCRNKFPPLTGLMTLLYAGGDGQEEMPGSPLPQPLRVAAFHGRYPVPGVRILFTAEGAGLVAANAGGIGGATNTLEVVTDANGLAECVWQLENDLTKPSQRLEARLLDSGGNPQPAVIHFSGSLSIAREVFYEVDPACSNLTGQTTVQAAIDRLSDLPSLFPLSGDGQHLAPGEAAQPLEVVVGSPCGPVAGATVRFTVVAGTGTLNGAGNTADVTTNVAGVATVTWQPDSATPNQVVEATLQTTPAALPTTARFTLSLRLEAGGGCAVTVGEGGQFPTLKEALGALLSAGRKPDIALCLLPGDHLVEGGINLQPPDDQSWNIEIVGSGPGTRIRLRRERIVASRLNSLALRHFDLRAEEVSEPLVVTECRELVIEGCHLSQFSLQTCLLTIIAAQRIRIADSLLESYFPWETIDIVTFDPLGAREIAAVTPDPFRRNELLAERLFNVDQPVALEAIKRIADFAMGRPGITTERRALLRNTATQLRRLLDSTNTSDERIGEARLHLLILMFSDTLSLADANADTALENVQFHGEVYLYGLKSNPIPLEEYRELAVRVVQNGLVLDQFRSDLQIRGCHFTRLLVERSALDLIENNENWRNLFRRCLLSDSVFFHPFQNTVLAGHVTLDSNFFDAPLNFKQVAMASISTSGTATGNAATSDSTQLIAATPPGRFREAANLLTLLPP
jgi:hypothetical protein